MLAFRLCFVSKVWHQLGMSDSEQQENGQLIHIEMITIKLIINNSGRYVCICICMCVCVCVCVYVCVCWGVDSVLLIVSLSVILGSLFYKCDRVLNGDAISVVNINRLNRRP